MGKTAMGGGASHWISGFDAGGCGAGIQITDGGMGGGSIIGSGGGYGGFYCFALVCVNLSEYINVYWKKYLQVVTGRYFFTGR